MNTRRPLALGVLVALLACSSAQASDSFRITAGGDQFWGPSTGGFDQVDTARIDKSGTMTGSGSAVGSVDYDMQAGPGIARVSMHGNVAANDNAPFDPSLQAISNTDLTVSGPDPEVNMSINLHVDGFLDDTVCGAGGPPCGALSVHIAAPTGVTARADSEFDTLGTTRGNGLGLAFDPVPGGYHVHGDITSAEFGLQTNKPNSIGIVLNLSGRFGGPVGSTFGGSFDDPDERLQVSFAPDGPVLNLPAGYTASGSNVVNNRWDDPFAGNFVVTDCDDAALADVEEVTGSLILRALDQCDGASFPKLTHIGGDLVVEDDRAPHVTFPGPVLVDGSVRVVGNDDGGAIDIGTGSVAGTVDISGNGGDLDIGIGSAAGVVDVSGTGGDLDIGIGSAAGVVDVSGTGGDLDIGIGSAAGTVDVSGTGGDLDIDPGTTSGDLDLSDNPDAGVVIVGAGQVGGDLTITDDGTAVVNANDSLTVSGDADVETEGGGMLDLSGVEAGGDETVAADNADGVTANSAGGTTDVSVLGGTAAMHVVLPDGTFDQPVAFTVTRRGDDPAEAGTASGGGAALVDPLAGYAFSFAVPALNANAALSFTIDLSALDAPTRAALLAAIEAGSATIVTKPDDPGSTYGAFARCTATQTPAANGCVAVTLLAGDGSVAPPGTEPAFARFDGIAGHFSTYAVALVTPSTPAGPTRAQIRALLRKQIVPRGKRGRIGPMLKRHGYGLPFRALTTGTGKVAWYRPRKGHKPIVIASGRHAFGAAGKATLTMKLTKAGRRQLRHAKRLRLVAKGAFTLPHDAPVTAKRRFTLKR